MPRLLGIIGMIAIDAETDLLTRRPAHDSFPQPLGVSANS